MIDYINISKFGMNKVRKFAMKFSYLILNKIVKIVSTRGQILRHKCTKIRFHWGSLQRSPSPPSWILGALLLRDEDGGGREWREGKGKRGDLQQLDNPMFKILKNTMFA